MKVTDLHRVFKLDNPIQPYAWGSHRAIAELLGKKSPSDQPQAEMWMGAHPNGSSRVSVAGQRLSLPDLIEDHPEAILGNDTAHRFHRRLPFLFKVLAAAQPLSIQAHPDQDQARSGFERENRLGIPIDAPHRNYRDDSHKPEIICALSPFWGLNGFQPPAVIARHLRSYGPSAFSAIAPRLEASDPARALRDFFTTLLKMSDTHRRQAIDEVVTQAHQQEEAVTAAGWVLRLHSTYPDDIGILAPLFLNLVCLQPGEAMFLAAGQLHAYLEGVGIELMANSDNVLRGGLTPKHIDVTELSRVLRYEAVAPGIITPQRRSASEAIYETDAAEFTLARIDIEDDSGFRAATKRSVEILLVVEGAVTLETTNPRLNCHLDKGESVIVPACLAGYTLQGTGRLFRAAVPLLRR